MKTLNVYRKRLELFDQTNVLTYVLSYFSMYDCKYSLVNNDDRPISTETDTFSVRLF